MKSVIEELLPFAVLIAVSVVGKVMERAKSKSQAPSQDPAPVPPLHTPPFHMPPIHSSQPRIDDDEPMEVPRHPEATTPVHVPPKPVQASKPHTPPVADIPDPLRNLMRMLTPAQAKPAVVEVHKPMVEVKHGETRTRVTVRPDAVEAHAKPILETTPYAVRQGMLWKTILDEPRYKRPWQPLSK